MTTLFKRVCSVIVGKPPPDYKKVYPDAIEVTGLRVQFKVEKNLSKTPNTCEITITNLSAQTRAAMQAKGSRVILQAGYPGTIAQIFSGDARFIDHVRSGPDWLTKIQCGDGERALQHARVSSSFGPGTNIKDVLRTAAAGLLVDPGNLDEKVAGITGQFVNGYAMHGKASRELDKALQGTGLEYSIQDGRLQLLAKGQANKDVAVDLSPSTGLIGSPEHGTPDVKGAPAVLKVKSLLQPSIRPGGRIRLRSEGQDGVFVVSKVTHEGDTAGGAWYTSIECAAEKR